MRGGGRSQKVNVLAPLPPAGPDVSHPRRPGRGEGRTPADAPPSSPLACLPLLLALFLFTTAGVTNVYAQGPGRILNVRALTASDATRLIINLSRPIPYQLTAEPPSSAQRPDVAPTRLDITFPSALLAPDVPSTLRVGDELLTSVRNGQVSAATVRISLELTGLGTYRAVDLRSPDQVVVVLRKPLVPRPEAETSRKESRPPRQEREPPDQTLESTRPLGPPSQTSRRYRIMLDPGHGGHDSGARGSHGIWEKNVVLTIGKRLAAKLQSRLPVEVMLTRSRDVFIPLPERTARANAAKADLFISIHANASPNRDTHGIETYYLDNTDDRATLRLARLENGVRTQDGRGRRGNDLTFILSDLIQTGKSEESVALARALQHSLVNHASKLYPEARNLGVKKGPFYVLVGAHMPCVLVETAFLSHAVEGKHLGTPAYQDALAEGLFRGIARFLREEIGGNL